MRYYHVASLGVEPWFKDGGFGKMLLQVAKNTGGGSPLRLVHSYATISIAPTLTLGTWNRGDHYVIPVEHIPNMPSNTFRLSFGGVAMVRFSDEAIDMYQLWLLAKLEQ
jgi:hypothetical protein